MWRSLVSRLNGVQEAAGSTPVTRTKKTYLPLKGRYAFFCLKNYNELFISTQANQSVTYSVYIILYMEIAMKKYNVLILSIMIECLIIILISIAALFDGLLFAVFYNISYGLLLSTSFPVFYMLNNKEDLTSVGIKKIGVRQTIILITFVFFSIGGQIIPKIIVGEGMAWELLPICILPLIMTTFFEEFLFRGFIQTRIEKQYGCLAAIFASATMFSLYHLGYPGFRTIEDISLLFAVGAGFAIAYKLSDNNLIVSYFVNLPNSFITYMLKAKKFPVFTDESNIYAAISIVLTVVILVIGQIKMKNILFKEL